MKVILKNILIANYLNSFKKLRKNYKKKVKIFLTTFKKMEPVGLEPTTTVLKTIVLLN